MSLKKERKSRALKYDCSRVSIVQEFQVLKNFKKKNQGLWRLWRREPTDTQKLIKVSRAKESKCFKSSKRLLGKSEIMPRASRVEEFKSLKSSKSLKILMSPKSFKNKRAPRTQNTRDQKYNCIRVSRSPKVPPEVPRIQDPQKNSKNTKSLEHKLSFNSSSLKVSQDSQNLYGLRVKES